MVGERMLMKQAEQLTSLENRLDSSHRSQSNRTRELETRLVSSQRSQTARLTELETDHATSIARIAELESGLTAVSTTIGPNGTQEDTHETAIRSAQRSQSHRVDELEVRLVGNQCAQTERFSELESRLLSSKRSQNSMAELVQRISALEAIEGEKPRMVARELRAENAYIGPNHGHDAKPLQTVVVNGRKYTEGDRVPAQHVPFIPFEKLTNWNWIRSLTGGTDNPYYVLLHQDGVPIGPVHGRDADPQHLSNGVELKRAKGIPPAGPPGPHNVTINRCDGLVPQPQPLHSEKSIIVFTDSSEEIDDQQAIHRLIEYLNMGKLEAVVVVFVNGDVSGDERRNQWIKTYASVSVPQGDKLQLLSMNEFLSMDCKVYGKALQIGPLKNDMATNFRLVGNYYFAGNYPTPAGDRASFNLDGSEATLEYWNKVNKVVDISSSLMATVRPTKTMYDWMPTVLQNETVKVGMKLFMTRASESLVYAEGLINSDYGRGANFITTSKVYTYATGKQIADIPIDPASASLTLAKRYFKNAKGGEDSILKLAQVNSAIESVFPGIWDTRQTVIYGSEFYDWVETPAGQKAFDKFVEIACAHYDVLNPMYDLFAAEIAITGNADLTREAFYQIYS